jgi:UDP-N-acetylglucosamine acyltransferase
MTGKTEKIENCIGDNIEFVKQETVEKLYDLTEHGFICIDGSNWIHKTAIVYPCVKMGKGNIIGAFSVIGSNGEIRNKRVYEFEGTVEIGDKNVISELVTIQRPFEKGKSTTIGSNNLIMAHTHIGHDAQVGNDCEICTTTVVGGYVTIKDGAKIKLHCVLRNRIIVGKHALVGMGSVVTKNVEDGQIVFGNPAKPKA